MHDVAPATGGAASRLTATGVLAARCARRNIAPENKSSRSSGASWARARRAFTSWPGAPAVGISTRRSLTCARGGGDHCLRHHAARRVPQQPVRLWRARRWGGGNGEIPDAGGVCEMEEGARAPQGRDMSFPLAFSSVFFLCIFPLSFSFVLCFCLFPWSSSFVFSVVRSYFFRGCQGSRKKGCPTLTA